MTLEYTNTNVQIAGSENGYPAVISNGIKLLTEATGDPLKITSTKYGNSKEIQITYGFRVLAGTTNLLFYKPDDTIGSDNLSPNMIL
jgi:hypothetical protein